MNNKRERIIELATQIASAREQLRQLEAEMDALLQQEGPRQRLSTPTADTVPAAGTAPNASWSDGFTLTACILDLLKTNADQKWNVRGIGKALDVSEEKLASLRSTLFRLAGSKRIDKVGPGMFRAKQEDQPAA